jgi:hypothetical protein
MICCVWFKDSSLRLVADEEKKLGLRCEESWISAAEGTGSARTVQKRLGDHGHGASIEC